MSMDRDGGGMSQAEHDRAFKVAGRLGEVPPWALTFMGLWAQPTRPPVTVVLANWPEDAPVPVPSYGQALRFLRRLRALRAARKGRKPLLAVRVVTRRRSSDVRRAPAA